MQGCEASEKWYWRKQLLSEQSKLPEAQGQATRIDGSTNHSEQQQHKQWHAARTKLLRTSAMSETLEQETEATSCPGVLTASLQGNCVVGANLPCEKHLGIQIFFSRVRSERGFSCGGLLFHTRRKQVVSSSHPGGNLSQHGDGGDGQGCGRSTEWCGVCIEITLHSLSVCV